MLPREETFDQFFFADMVLDSLKKNSPKFPMRVQKGPLLYLASARPHLADHEIRANNLTRLSHPAYSPVFTPADFWLFGYLKVILEGSSFEMAKELQEKTTDILMSIPTSTFRAVFDEWKSQLLRRIEAGGIYL
jgi:hypothetical protein